MHGDWDSEWEPVPLELPLEQPVRRSPVAPVDGEAESDDQDDSSPTVIVIDLT